MISPQPSSTRAPYLAAGTGESTASPRTTPRILIVDDSRVARSVFVAALGGKYDCLTAESYDDALECLRMHEIDLVLSDVIMPGLSGVELLRKVIATFPDTAVIMASSIDRSQRALDTLRLGAMDYLIKPCDTDVLQLTVERALERRQLLIDARKYRNDLEVRNAELVASKAELQRLQAQVIQNEKMIGLGQIAAGIAHELNNPVAFLTGNLEMVSETVGAIARLVEFYDSAELPESVAGEAAAMREAMPELGMAGELDQMLADCREGTERIQDIVQNLRTFSHLDEAKFKRTDVNADIDATLRLLSQYFRGGNITVTKDYGELPPTDAFASQLSQVWMNLLVNAAQAIGDKRGEVVITTACDGDEIVVTVADNGGGIAKQHLGRIFEPFFTTKPVGEGTGLGLSITFGIVDRHGGTIAVESQLAVGTTFTVRLPVKMALEMTQAETAIEMYEM